MYSSVPEFKVIIDRQACRQCKRCVENCSFGALEWREERVKSFDDRCVACQRCVSMCPEDAITLRQMPSVMSAHPIWTENARRDVFTQSRTGAILLASTGNELHERVIFDNLLLDACQVTNPAIDPLREPIELRTYIGRKPQFIELEKQSDRFELKTEISPALKLELPIMIAQMSYGAISVEAHEALARAAVMRGTTMGSGEGGLHKKLYPYADHIIVQVASGRFGVHPAYLEAGAGVEIKIGQGAKPGIGGHLPGTKITDEISEARMIPLGADAISPAPHHDIYSIEDLAQLVNSLKEATRYKKPIFVKIAAVHNVAAISSGICRAGADAIVIDGFRAGTGATPKVIRDNVGIPIELAIASVDQRLREEGIRNETSLIASGTIRNSGDVAKAIALGADAVKIGTAALIALGCTVCKRCYTGKCAWGIATQDPRLRSRLDPVEGAQRVSNLLLAWSIELKEILGAAGINAIESLRGNRDRLRGYGLDHTTLEILGVQPAGS
ncbi:MAG TPA: glutamate synthase-related protein [Candidatus Bathyarchaeia archaeon]|nr:glutamate synthase-related protein [Candidatus Bathyarchaeia archaeon]